MGGWRHAPAALPPGKTRYPLYRRLGGPQGRSGRVRKISPPRGFDPRTVQPVASLYTTCTIPAHEAYARSYINLPLNCISFTKYGSLHVHNWHPAVVWNSFTHTVWGSGSGVWWKLVSSAILHRVRCETFTEVSEDLVNSMLSRRYSYISPQKMPRRPRGANRPCTHSTGGLVGAMAVLFSLQISPLVLKCLKISWSKRISAYSVT